MRIGISATTQQALQKLHAFDASGLQNKLEKAAAGDAKAIETLALATGASPGEISTAAQVFAQDAFEGLFAGVETAQAKVTGAGPKSAFNAAQGGVSAGRVGNMLAMRSGGMGTNPAQVGKEIAPLVTERAGLKETIAGLTTKIATLETSLSELKLNRRERWFGGVFAGVLGGDKNKAGQGKSIRIDIEENTATLQHTRYDLGSTGRKIDSKIRSALKAGGDLTYKKLDAEYGRTHKMLDTSKDLLSDIDSALGDISDVMTHERREQAEAIAATMQTPGTPATPNAMSTYNEYAHQQAHRDAESSLDDVADALRPFEDALKNYGSRGLRSELSDTDLSHDLHPSTYAAQLLASGSPAAALFPLLTGLAPTAMARLQDAQSELKALKREVSSVVSSVSNDATQATRARQAYVDDFEAQAIATLSS